jgi:hypothetical protein
MKYQHKLFYLLAMAVYFTACKNEPIMFDNSKAFVSFTSTTAAINENANIGDIPVMVSAVEGSAPVTVGYEVVTNGISTPALEGVDFNIVSDSSLDFPEGTGYAYISVQPVDNPDLTGNKSFKLVLTSNSENYPTGAQDTITVVLKDDEHPLFKWIGDYIVSAESFIQDSGNFETWYVTTEPDPNDYNYLIIRGISTEDSNPIKARIDLENGEIIIAQGQWLGDIYTDNEGNPMGIGIYKSTDGHDDIIKDEPLVGKIFNDGTILIDLFGELVISGKNKNRIYDIYNTTWTKE